MDSSSPAYRHLGLNPSTSTQPQRFVHAARAYPSYGGEGYREGGRTVELLRSLAASVRLLRPIPQAGCR